MFLYIVIILDFDLQGGSLQTPSNTIYDHQLTISSLNELTVSSIGAVSGNSGTSQGWMNTVPLSSSATNTLNKRTANNLRMKRQNGNANQDLYVKDYIKKRILILDLLVRIYHRFRYKLILTSDCVYKLHLYEVNKN